MGGLNCVQMHRSTQSCRKLDRTLMQSNTTHRRNRPVQDYSSHLADKRLKSVLQARLALGSSTLDPSNKQQVIIQPRSTLLSGFKCRSAARGCSLPARLQPSAQYPRWCMAHWLNGSHVYCSEPVAKGLRKLVLEVEISRDKVPIRNGYRHVGQRARIRANSGVEHELLGESESPPPFHLPHMSQNSC